MGDGRGSSVVREERNDNGYTGTVGYKGYRDWKTVAEEDKETGKGTGNDVAMLGGTGDG